MLEREKTFLLKHLPKNLFSYPFTEIEDMYIPGKHPTAQIRFRKNAKGYCFTKKCPIDPNNRSSQQEQTISVDKEEFNYIWSFLSNKIKKHRYSFLYQHTLIEIDIFLDELSGLIMADIEFLDEETKENFQMPDFCLCEVTQDLIFTGGFLCGKTYEDISPRLEELGYTKIA